MGKESLTQSSAWPLLKCHTGALSCQRGGHKCPLFMGWNWLPGRSQLPRMGTECWQCWFRPRRGEVAVESIWLPLATKELPSLPGGLWLRAGLRRCWVAAGADGGCTDRGSHVAEVGDFFPLTTVPRFYTDQSVPKQILGLPASSGRAAALWESLVMRETKPPPNPCSQQYQSFP